MTKPCAFRDCGDPTCHLCALARQPSTVTKTEKTHTATGKRLPRKEKP
jgi:hypothetical protein